MIPKQRGYIRKVATPCLGLTAAVALLLCPATLVGGDVANAVREGGTMTVGVRGDYPPFSTATGEGEDITFSGFDVDIARGVAERIGAEVKFMVVGPEETIPLVAEGIVQAAPGLRHRLSWERVIDFSVTYFMGGTRALVLSASGIDRLSSLKRRPIAVVAGTDDDEIIQRLPDAKIVSVDSPGAGLLLLQDRQVSALIGDANDLLNLMALSERPERLRIVNDAVMTVPVALGLPPDDGTWREAVDRALIELWASGEFQKIYERWFGKRSRTPFPLTFTMEIWPN